MPDKRPSVQLCGLSRTTVHSRARERERADRTPWSPRERCRPGARRALAAGGRGTVEFALHPGGYVRLGDDWLLLAMPARPARPADAARRGPRGRAAGRGRRPVDGRRAAARGVDSRRPARRATRRSARSRVGALRVDLSRIGRPPLALVAPPLAPGWRLALTAALEAAPGAPRELADGLAALRHGDAGRGRRRARRARGGAHARRRRRRSPATRRGGTRRASRSRSTAAALLAARARLPALRRAGRAARAGRRACCARSAPATRRRTAPGAGAVALGRELRRCHAVGRSRQQRARERDRTQLHRPALPRRERAGRAERSSRTRCSRTCGRAACTGARSSSSPSAATSARWSQLERDEGDEILVGVRDARVLAGPDEVAFVDDESVDTGNASQLARASATATARVTVVEGRFQHVNFIFAPAPLRIRVVEVVPPHPPKLLEMAHTVLDYDEDLPPLQLDFVADRPARARAPRTRPSTTCSPAAARAWSSARRSTSSTPARPTPPTGRCSAASARARSTPRSTATSRTSASTSARCWSRASRGRSRRCSSAACASAGSSGRDARMTVPWGASLEEVRARAAQELAA